MSHRRYPLLSGVLFLLLFQVPSGVNAEADAPKVVAAWTVHSGDLMPAEVGPEGALSPAEQKKVWMTVRKIIPPAILAQVGRFEVFQAREGAESSTSTDGYALGSEDGSWFTLGLNLDSIRTAILNRDPEALREFEPTIVHELGHIISFQASQMAPEGSVEGTLVIDEGTLKPDSYLNLFYDRFWKKTYPDHGPVTTDDKTGTDLYNKAPNSFVTEYAATGPLEDFAESFARYVLMTSPPGNTVKDQKTRFFGAWPELVALRTQMRTGLATAQ